MASHGGVAAGPVEDISSVISAVKDFVALAPQASASAGTTNVCLTDYIPAEGLVAPVPNEPAPSNRISLQNPLAPVPNARSSAAAGSTAPAVVNDVGICSSDDDGVDKNQTDITDDAAWQDALTIMMFYEQLSGASTDEKTWFDASIEPKLRLTQAQRKVIASLCEQLLFGFRTEGATENERRTCEPTTAAKNLTLLINTMQPILQLRAQ